MTHLVIIGGSDAGISAVLRPFSFRHVFLNEVTRER